MLLHFWKYELLLNNININYINNTFQILKEINVETMPQQKHNIGIATGGPMKY